MIHPPSKKALQVQEVAGDLQAQDLRLEGLQGDVPTRPAIQKKPALSRHVVLAYDVPVGLNRCDPGYGRGEGVDFRGRHTAPIQPAPEG